MKKNILIVILFIFCSAQAQKTTTEEVVHPIYGKATVTKSYNKKENLIQKLIYTKDSIYTKGHSKIGECILYYDNGNVRAKGNFFEPKKRWSSFKKYGEWLRYRENGKLSFKVTFKDNKEEGTYTSYHENGKILEQGTYLNGRVEGDAKQFFSSGQVHRVITYKEDKVFNVKEFYGKNSKTLEYGTFKDGNGTLKYYDLETGEFLKTYTFQNGIAEDIETTIAKTSKGDIKTVTYKYNDERPKRIERYLDDKLNGLQEYFYTDGNVKETISYIGGVKSGSHKKYFHDTKKIKEEANYLNGKLSGIKRVYNEDGTLFYEFTYVNGIKTGPFRETPEGTKKEFYVLDEGFYNEEENKTGKYTSYLIDKKTIIALGEFDKNKAIIVTSGYYENGKKVGLWKQFDATGNLLHETNYSEKKSGHYSKKVYFEGTETKRLKSSIFYRHSTNIGSMEKYYPNGQLKLKSVLKGKIKKGSSTRYLEGGKYTEFYEDGTLKVTGQKNKDKKTGQWKRYNEKGLIVEDYVYKDHNHFAAKRIDYNYDDAYHLSSIIIQDGHKQNPLNENEYFFSSSISKDFNENGTIRELVSTKKFKYGLYGVKHGLYQRYDHKGELEVEGYYNKDKKDSIWKYYNYSGTLRSETTYALGEKRGPFEAYEYYGKTKQKKKSYVGVNYADSKKQKITSYYENSGIEKVGNYTRFYKKSSGNSGSEGIWKYYHENGKLRATGNYIEGSKEGVWKSFHENGKKDAKGAYLNGVKDGDWKYYYNNKKLKSEGNYSKGYEIGDWKYYHSNGKIKAQGSFMPLKEETLKLKKKLKEESKIGEWKYFYEKGGLKEKSTYKMAANFDFLFQNKKVYYQGGQLKSEEEFEGEEGVGIHTYYNENGIISIKNVFKKNEDEWEWVLKEEYDIKGNLKCVIEYIESAYGYEPDKLKEKCYYSNKQLKFEKEYDYGYLTNVLSYFDKKGNKLNVGTLKDGDGTLNYYDENNKVIKIETYDDGELKE